MQRFHLLGPRTAWISGKMSSWSILEVMDEYWEVWSQDQPDVLGRIVRPGCNGIGAKDDTAAINGVEDHNLRLSLAFLRSPIFWSTITLDIIKSCVLPGKGLLSSIQFNFKIDLPVVNVPPKCQPSLVSDDEVFEESPHPGKFVTQTISVNVYTCDLFCHKKPTSGLCFLSSASDFSSAWRHASLAFSSLSCGNLMERCWMGSFCQKSPPRPLSWHFPHQALP